MITHLSLLGFSWVNQRDKEVIVAATHAALRVLLLGHDNASVSTWFERVNQRDKEVIVAATHAALRALLLGHERASVWFVWRQRLVNNIAETTAHAICGNVEKLKQSDKGRGSV
ncbi:hypothetical protein J6590_006391 [Homalodisca vitripennis]|nr:hypothetical protein J6590_006391 [Homalodisca vitripennis]